MSAPLSGGMGETPWRNWVGRTQILFDTIIATPARALAATLNRPNPDQLRPGAELPGPWVWLYFLSLTPSSEIADDGHPKRGGFLPPVHLPRRMWAGSRCTFHAPIHIGDDLERVSTITKVTEKAGTAGPMVFVTAHHAISHRGAVVMEEEQDIVYLTIPDRFEPPPAVALPDCAWREVVPVDPVLLFRFSALTFNAHRIHYDRAYAAGVERYPGLVVHGPLQAILLFDAACRNAPDRTPARFEFRGLRPVFDSDVLTLNGRPREGDGMDLFTADGDGTVGMRASLGWRAR